MKELILDLWHDLRRKRLWPVALALVVALVALPVFLKKSSHPVTPPSPPSVASPSRGDGAVVVAATDTGSSASKLNAFAAKNPFKPHLPKVKQSSAPSGGSAPASSPSQPSGGAPSGGGGTGTGTVVTPTKPQPKGPFAYVVDVKFGKRHETKTHHDVQKLDLLPNANDPLLVFMGVNTAGDTAVFLTDTSLKASGEGDCKPSADVCSFLYLKLDAQHDTEDLLATQPDGSGIEYTLKLLAIHKVPVSELAKKASAQAKKAAKQARKLKGKPAAPFHFPLKLPQLPDELNG